MIRSFAAAARAVALAGALFTAGACAGLFDLDQLDRCTSSACDAEAGPSDSPDGSDGPDAVASGVDSGSDAACVDPLGHSTDPCAMTPSECSWGPIYSSAPPGESAVMALTADTTYIYWTAQPSSAGGQQGSVLRIPKSGGAAERLATSENRPRAIAVDDTNVYWTAEAIGDGGTEVVRSVEKVCAPPCQVQTIDSLRLEPPEYLAVLGNMDLFFVGDVDQRYAFDVDAGEWVAGIRWPAGPYSAAAVSPTAIYAGNEAQPFLYRLPLDGTVEDTLVDFDSGVGVVGLVADCSSVFVEFSTNKFARINPADGGVVALQAPDGYEFMGSTQFLAVDDTFVYFAVPNSGVSRVLKRGSVPPVLVAPIPGAFGIATDDDATYFGNSMTGAIYRILK